MEATSQVESTKAAQESRTTSKTGVNFLNILPREIRDMIYGLVIGDSTIHIRSDVVPKQQYDLGNAKDDKDEDEDESEEDDLGDEDKPQELAAIKSDARGPLYHSTCDMELRHPDYAQLYRTRTLKANGSSNSREQSSLEVKDYRNVNGPIVYDPALEYETIGSLLGDYKPIVEVELAFLRTNRQVYEEASTILYATKTFGFDDHTTFAQFFSIAYDYDGEPPTSTIGTALLTTKRNLIRSLHIRAKTAFFLRSKVLWMAALDAATFVLPALEKIHVLFDLCIAGRPRFYLDQTLWQYSRHQHGFPLLKTAEVSVASDVSVYTKKEYWHLCPMIEEEYGFATEEGAFEFRDDEQRRVQLLEAIVGHHLDTLFGGSLLDPAAVEEREAIFDRG